MLLLGLAMTAMWLASSLLIWSMVPHLSFLYALAIGACVTPIDPVLLNSNILKDLKKIITAESGVNDRLGYPFVFLAPYLIKYTGEGGLGQDRGARTAIGL